MTSLGRELNVEHPKYEVRMPITGLRHPVILWEVRGQFAVNQQFVKIRGNRAVLEKQETWQGNGIAEGIERKCRSVSLMVHSKVGKCVGPKWNPNFASTLNWGWKLVTVPSSLMSLWSYCSFIKSSYTRNNFYCCNVHYGIYILFTHQQMHFLLSLETLTFT